MSRFRVLLLLFAAALFGALQNGRPILWGMAGALFALLVIGVAWAWTGVNWVRVARRTSVRIAQAGQMLEEEFRLTNLSLIPKLWIEVRDQSTLPQHFASRVVGMIGGSQWRGWRARTRCILRGRYHLGPLEVRSGDPLGIYQMRRKIDIVNTLLVYPATYDLRSFPTPATHLPDGDAMRRRTHQITANAAGVRDYVNGDSINRIHWPSSARRQRLMVKEFELDPAADIYIALDLSARAQAGAIDWEALERAAQADAPVVIPASTEEYGVITAATCARYFLNQGREVGLIVQGAHRHTLSAERGDRQLNKIFETLAVLRSDGELPFGRVLAAECISLPRGMTLIAISASLDLEWAAAVQSLARNGLRVVAIFIDSTTFGAQGANAEIIRALESSGAVVRVIRCGEPIGEILER
jgi:uncharacterized protein (DUF58 family)